MGNGGSGTRTAPRPAPRASASTGAPRGAPRTASTAATRTYAPLTTAATPAQRDAVQRQAQAWVQSGERAPGRAEVGAWIIADGRTVAQTGGHVWNKQGAQSIGTITNPAEKAALRAAKAAGQRPEFLHTHPAEHGSLSKADLRWAMRERFAAIHAIGTGPNGTGTYLYTLRPGPQAGPKGMWNRETLNRLGLLGKTGLYTRIEAQVNARLDAAIQRGSLTAERAEATWAHQVMSQLAKEVGPDILRYSAKPLKGV